MDGRLFATEHGLGQSEILSRAGRNRQPFACVRKTAGRPFHRGAAIDMLEHELGVRLVERLSRSYRLTAEGERVRDLARGLTPHRRYRALCEQRRPLAAPGRSGQRAADIALPVSRAAPSAASGTASSACASNWSARPVRSVSVEAKPIWRCGWSSPLEKGVVARRLAVVAYGLYGSRDYLAGCGEDAQEFLGYDDSLDHLPQQRWLKMLAGDRSLALRSNDLANLLTAARAGLGLAVLPCIMARGAPDLVSVPTRLPPLTRELWLLFHRDVGRTPAVRAVIGRITAITAAARAAFLG